MSIIEDKYNDEVGFLNYLIDKDKDTTQEEEYILQSAALTAMYAPLKTEIENKRAEREAMIVEQKAIVAKAKYDYDSLQWRLGKYKELGVNEGVSTLVESLPDTDVKNKCINDNSEYSEYRNVNTDMQSWVSEQVALNQYKKKISEGEYLQLEFTIEEQREARTYAAMKTMEKWNLYISEKQKATEDWNKQAVTGREIRNKKLNDHYKVIRDRLLQNSGVSNLASNEWIVSGNHEDPNKCIEQIDFVIANKPSFAQVNKIFSDVSKKWIMYFKIDFNEYLDAQRAIRAREGYINYFYPRGKTNYSATDTLERGIIPMVDLDRVNLFYAEMLESCFPFSDTVAQKGQEAFSNFIAYGELVAFPESPDQKLWAIRRYSGWGTMPYAEYMVDVISTIYSINANSNMKQHIYLNPLNNINIDIWWSERPSATTFFVPHIGWVNPFYFENLHPHLYSPAPDDLGFTPEKLASLWYGSYKLDGSFAYVSTNYEVDRRRKAVEERAAYGNRLLELANSAMDAKNIFQQMDLIGKTMSLAVFKDEDTLSYSGALHLGGEVLGKVYKEINPVHLTNEFLRNNPVFAHSFNELDKLTGGLLTSIENVTQLPGDAIAGEPISPARIAEALEMMLKVAAIVFSGGSATAIIGVTSSQLKKGTLGQTELGRALLSIGEAVAIAQVANSGIMKAVEAVAEQQVKGMTINEAIKAAGKNNEILAAIAATALVEGGASSIKGGSFTTGLQTGAVSGTKQQVVSKVPGGDILWGAAAQVKDTGSLSISNPLDAFKNLKFSDFKKSVSKEGSVGGAINQTTLDFLRKQLVKAPETIKKVLTPEEERIEKEKKDKEYFNAKSSVIEKLGRGEIPSSSELKLIHPEAEKFLNALKGIIPVTQMGDALNLGLKLGFPAFNLPSLDLPDWDVPGMTTMPGQPFSSFDFDLPTADFPTFKIPSLPSLNLSMDLSLPNADLGIEMPSMEIPKMSIPDLQNLIMLMMPRGVALTSPESDEIKIIGVDGKIKVKTYRSPYEHAMLSFNLVPRRITEENMQQRLLEMQYLELQAAQIQKALSYNELQLSQLEA